MPFMDERNTLVWYALKPYLPADTTLTSVYRSQEHQLSIIVKRARHFGFRFTRPPMVGDPNSWEPALRFLRQRDPSNPVAPPNRSQHQKGIAYDLSGSDLNKIAAGVRAAADAGSIRLRPGAKNPRVEGVCVHVEIEGASLDYDPYDWT